MTAEESIEETFMLGMIEKDFEQFKRNYPTLLKVMIASHKKYARNVAKKALDGAYNISFNLLVLTAPIETP